MESTAPGTPQHDGIVDQRFAIDGDKALSMMLAGQLKPDIQKLLWAEATKCVSLQTNITINTATIQPPDQTSLCSEEHSRRNLKRAVPLRVERESVRSSKRLAAKAGNAKLIENETRAIMPTPREQVRQEYQKELEE
jgi:hypothetical protein